MAAFTTTAVERFIKSGRSRGKTACDRSGTAAACACGSCRRGRPRGSSSTACAALGRSGTQKTVTLGAWPVVDVRKAAEEARRLAGEVAAGRDPRADIRETKRRERADRGGAPSTTTRHGPRAAGLRKVPTMMSALRRGLSHLLQRDLARTRPRGPDRRHRADRAQRQDRCGARLQKASAHVPQPPAVAWRDHRSIPWPDTGCPPPPRTTCSRPRSTGKSLNEDEIVAALAGGVGHRRAVRRPGEDGPPDRPSAGRTRRHALGLDRPRRLEDHGSGQGDEERPRACGSDHLPDRASCSTKRPTAVADSCSRAKRASAARRRCRAGRS